MKAEHTRKVLERLKAYIQSGDIAVCTSELADTVAAIIADLEAGEVTTNAHPDGNGTVCTGLDCQICGIKN